MGIAAAQTQRQEEDFWQVFRIQWQEDYTKAEISKIQQRGFALEMDKKKEVGDILKEKYERIYQKPRYRKQTNRTEYNT